MSSSILAPICRSGTWSFDRPPSRHKHLVRTEAAQPESSGCRFPNSRPLDELYISIVTIAEIRFGINAAKDARRRAELDQWLTNTIRPMFAGRMLGIMEEVIVRRGTLVEAVRKSGRMFPQPDLLIAANALEHDLVAVTRNVKDFAGLGLTIFNPWDD